VGDALSYGLSRAPSCLVGVVMPCHGVLGGVPSYGVSGAPSCEVGEGPVIGT